MLLLSACRDGNEPSFGRSRGWEDGRFHQRWLFSHLRAAGKVSQREMSRETRNADQYHAADQSRLPSVKYSPDESIPEWTANLTCFRRRTTRPSSAGAATTTESWDKATRTAGATMPTVLAQPAPPPCFSCRPHVSSPLLLLSACRDGDEPPFGRPGGREDGRSRQCWRFPHVRAAGKFAQCEIDIGQGSAKSGNLAPLPEPAAGEPLPQQHLLRLQARNP